ncbi:hypothetical protein Fcan01_16512 [Folsomia candida]|uniref:Uncharacterized protein n=1 Tax=Folsomia candida TaxID=158441 RepID=A0A226DU84_FOLCA|nr:hypothetical protein Fcan01_16512 [Folsomia candida]
MNWKLVALIIVISAAANPLYSEKDNSSHPFTPGLNEKEIITPSWMKQVNGPKLRILDYPEGHERSRYDASPVKGFSSVGFFIGLLASAIYIRLRRISKTESPLEKDILRRQLPRDLVYLALIGFGVIYLVDCLYVGIQAAIFDTWTFADRFSLQLGPANEKVNFDVVFSMKWRNLPATQRGPEGAHFATFLSNLLEDLDTKVNNLEAKNNSSHKELDVYLASVRLWLLSPPSSVGGDPEVRSKWVNFLNEMGTFLEEQRNQYVTIRGRP